MRPLSTKQNPLRYPLNELLGRESNVRILRYLATVSEPVGIRDISGATGITVAGVSRALVSLVKTTFVVQTGTKRQKQFSIRENDGLKPALFALFTRERIQYEELISSLRTELDPLSPAPESAWIQRSERATRNELDIGLLSGSESIDEQLRNLRKRLYEIENEFEITIEIQGYTEADRADIETENTVHLYGIPMTVVESSGNDTISHTELDTRARIRARILAGIVEDDPSLVTSALAHIDRLGIDDSGPATRELEEWRDILSNYSKNRLLKFLVSNSPRAERLRQSSPFMAVLKENQKKEMRSGE